jgi:hypothetical protein
MTFTGELGFLLFARVYAHQLNSRLVKNRLSLFVTVCAGHQRKPDASANGAGQKLRLAHRSSLREDGLDGLHFDYECPTFKHCLRT